MLSSPSPRVWLLAASAITLSFPALAVPALANSMVADGLADASGLYDQLMDLENAKDLSFLDPLFA